MLNSILAGIVFGAIGLYYFGLGKKRLNYTQIFLGIALMVYPYFVTNDYWVWAVGAALTFAAHYARE